MDDIYKLDVIGSCNCDCTNQHNHECIKVYVCEKHLIAQRKGMMMTCDMSTCDMSTCEKCNGLTTSGCEKYCDGCSAIFGICKYCGKN